ncbi:hypothetical protein [Paractinoplanes globisporus]|uniref:Uncharacterized protein n=1 Tax=Paractinoplanes globisporus TaxID=113565 RepID=A0ABW6WAU7_9ACTN|nr:hypothetical protein [Actinoplanes globisporus]
MTTNEKTVDQETVAGGSTDQHITGAGEQGTFLTDEPPTSKTPANGSSNRGINKLHANREDVEEDLAHKTR